MNKAHRTSRLDPTTNARAPLHAPGNLAFLVVACTARRPVIARGGTLVGIGCGNDYLPCP